MTPQRTRFRLLSPFQRGLHRVLVVLGILVLANSVYLFGYTLWQELSDARARLLTSYQWMLITHFVVATLFLGLVLTFSALHLRRVLRHRSTAALISGGVTLLACVTLLLSGLYLLKLANTQENRWVFQTHRIGGLVALAAYLVHRWRSHDPTPLRARWRTAAVTAAAVLLMTLAHLGESLGTEPPMVVHNQAFQALEVSEDPFVPFEPLADVDPSSAFFPSPTTLASGGRLDPSVLVPGPAADLAALEEEYRERGFTSSQAIGAEDCRLCHQDTVEQWEGSAHRFSSFNNPFYTASLLGLRKLEGGAQASQFCGGCHDPAVMLAGDFLAEIDRDSVEAQAGLTCTACHLVNRIHDVTGNGNYELADHGEDPYLFAGATEGWKLELRKYLIKARPRDHKDFFLRPFYRVPEYCAACHKVSVDSEINAYRWLRGQDEYDNWHDSGVSRNAARTFYLPSGKVVCQDCHMPHVPAPGGDLAAKGGLVRSHRFLAANTALPHVRGDDEVRLGIERFLRGDKLRVDLFALEHPRAGLVMDPRSSRPELRRGDEVVLYVVVRNLGVGHTFPGGTNDSNQGWIRLEVRDAQGRVVRSSGQIADDGFLDPESHQYKSVMLTAEAEPALERDAHRFHVAGLMRVIPPGNVDIARYRITVPDTESLTIDAQLLWRKFNRSYTLFSYRELGLDPPDLPVTEIAADRLELQVGVPRPATERGRADWMRYNDLGIGLLGQGDSKGALQAFAKVAEGAPGRVDGFRNQARVHLTQGDPGPVRALLEASEERAPGDPQTMLWWAEYLELEGDLESAGDMYEAVLEHFLEDRDTWRRLADLRFRLREYDASLAAALQALRIDPEDVAAHYQRMLIYRATGDEEKERHARVAFEKYRIDDNAPQVIKQWRLHDEIADREVDALHVH